jgi:tetratricopeptide (TPR) repeat protein
MAGAHLALGFVAIRDADLKEARRELEQAMGIFEETANDPDLARALNELGRVERLEGQTGRAVELLERSIALTAGSDAPILAEAQRELGLTLVGSDHTTAGKHLRIAIELYERTEQSFETAITYRALGDLFDASGEGEAACDAYRTGITALEPAV